MQPGMWSLVLWAVLGVGLIVYVLSGGADLGAGLWSLLASGPRKAEQREAVRHAIAPIWEANHVWLIFIIVLTFTAFSRAFAALSIALHIPIALALLGLVFRGSAYAFRAYGIQGQAASLGWDRVFAWASVFTPVCLGCVAGGMSSGAIRVRDGQILSGYVSGWTNPFALGVGLFTLALCALLAAVYLAAETDGALQDDFRRRALISEVVSGVLAAATWLLAREHAPLFHANLAHSAWSWSVQIATAGFALATIALVLKRQVRGARYTAAAQVALVVIGWGLALDGHFILPDVSLSQASANPEVMPAIALTLLAGSLLLVPSLYYLYRVFKRSAEPGSHDA
jgi:cytochrome bd ubiquinol oxidase subunit II